MMIGDFLFASVYTEQTDVNNLRLYITDIEESDAGQYTCTARLATPSVESENQTDHHQQQQQQYLLLSEEVKLFLYGQLRHRTVSVLESRFNDCQFPLHIAILLILFDYCRNIALRKTTL